MCDETCLRILQGTKVLRSSKEKGKGNIHIVDLHFCLQLRLCFLLFKMDLQPILNDCSLPSAACAPVSGGDINPAFSLDHRGARYFLKVNDALRFPNMFVTERNGLLTLSDASFRTPAVLRCGVAGGKQYLLMEWINTGRRTADFWKTFGRSLAALHAKDQAAFGWHEHNYIGSLVQRNDVCDRWPDFFRQYRVMPLVKMLRDSGKYTATDVSNAEKFCDTIDDIFPEEKPSLVHGDLWSGNFMVDKNNQPLLIDPAVYCGHREMDIGMTKLFGGFDDIFYREYCNVFPLQKGWEERMPVSQLYPLLVHAVLFGGSYVNRTIAIVNR